MDLSLTIRRTTAVQMRTGQPVDLLERALVGQRHSGEQQRKPRVAIARRSCALGAHQAGFGRASGPSATARRVLRPSRLSARASTNSRSDSRLR